MDTHPVQASKMVHCIALELVKHGDADVHMLNAMYAARNAAFLSLARDYDSPIDASVRQLCDFDAATSPLLRAHFTTAVTQARVPAGCAILYALLSAAHCDGSCEKRHAVKLTRDLLLRMVTPLDGVADAQQRLRRLALQHRLLGISGAVVSDLQGPGSCKGQAAASWAAAAASSYAACCTAHPCAVREIACGSATCQPCIKLTR